MPGLVWAKQNLEKLNRNLCPILYNLVPTFKMGGQANSHTHTHTHQRQKFRFVTRTCNIYVPWLMGLQREDAVSMRISSEVWSSVYIWSSFSASTWLVMPARLVVEKFFNMPVVRLQFWNHHRTKGNGFRPRKRRPGSVLIKLIPS